MFSVSKYTRLVNFGNSYVLYHTLFGNPYVLNGDETEYYKNCVASNQIHKPDMEDAAYPIFSAMVKNCFLLKSLMLKC